MLFARTLLASLSLLLSLGASAESVDLKFHPAKGATLKLKQTSDQKITQTVNDAPATVNQTIALGYTFAVQDADEKGTILKVTYDSVVFKQHSQLGNVEYDSSAPPPTIPAAARGFSTLIGLSVTIRVDPSGHVLDVQGIDAMLEEIIKRLDIPDGPTKPLLEKSLQKDFGPDALRESMESMLLIYPDKTVSPGDAWGHTLSITKGFPIVMSNEYKLQDLTADTAKIELKSKLATKPDAAPIDMGARKLTYDLSGEETGTLTLARADGVIRAADTVQKVTGKMLVEAADGKTEVPLSIETHKTLETK